jgi:hypothetical protein
MIIDKRQCFAVAVFLPVFIFLNLSSAEQLVIGANEYHDNLNPVYAKKNVEKNIISMIFETPLKFDNETTSHVANLCKYIRGDGCAYLYPNPQAKASVFHDGENDIRKSIIYSINKLREQEDNIYGNYFKKPELTDEKGPFMVKIPFEGSQGLNVDMSRMTFPVFSNGSLNKGNDHNYKGNRDIKDNTLAGTGPFEIKEDNLNYKKVVLQRFERYRETWEGNLKKIIFQEKDSLSVLIDSLLQSDRDHGNYIDVLPGLYLKHTNTVLEKKSKVKVKNSGKEVDKSICYTLPQTPKHFYYIGFNYKKAGNIGRKFRKNPCRVFMSYEFRKFVAKAFDKRAFFNNQIGNGGGRLLNTPYKIESSSDNIDIKEYLYGIKNIPDEYRELEFGFSYYSEDPVAKDVALSFKAAMKEVGVTIKVEAVDLPSTWKMKTEEGRFDFIYNSYEYGLGRNLSGFLTPRHKDNILGYEPSSNIDSILNEIKGKTDLMEIEHEKDRLSAAMSTECVVIFLWSIKKSTAFRSEVNTGKKNNIRHLFDNIHKWDVNKINWINK